MGILDSQIYKFRVDQEAHEGSEGALGPVGLAALRDRALLLVGIAGARWRSELAAIRVKHLEKTERRLRLTILQTKGSQATAVIVCVPYGQTEL